MSQGGDHWRPRAQLPGYRGVLDPGDVDGRKNRHIHLVHELALASNLRIPRGGTVLDFGCGVGRMTDYLARRAGAVIGLDVTPEMIAEAESRPHPASVRYQLVQPGAPIPLEDASVDLVLTIYVLQHVLEDGGLDFLLGEFRRVLKPGGRVASIEQLRSDPFSEEGFKLQRTAAQYVRAFERAGLSRRRVVTVRVPSPMAGWVGSGRVPQSLAVAAAASEMLGSRLLAYRRSYRDTLMIFRKPAR